MRREKCPISATGWGQIGRSHYFRFGDNDMGARSSKAEILEQLAADRPRRLRPPGISEHDLLTINYTSGTTFRPKGVMITHRNAYMNAVGRSSIST